MAGDWFSWRVSPSASPFCQLTNLFRCSTYLAKFPVLNASTSSLALSTLTFIARDVHSKILLYNLPIRMMDQFNYFRVATTACYRRPSALVFLSYTNENFNFKLALSESHYALGSLKLKILSGYTHLFLNSA